MKRALVAFAVLAFAAGCSSDPDATPAPGDKTVVVLFTSDEHSHLFSFSPELDDRDVATEAGDGALQGGVARRATVIKKERSDAAAAGKDSILVSSGDNQMGALPHLAFTEASIDYATMKDLGYDVTTLGNHELDFGPDALAKSIAVAKAGLLPPIVASNIHFDAGATTDLSKDVSSDAGDDAPIHPYRVLTTAGGLKIGVVGWVGVDAENVARNKAPVRFSSKDASEEGDVTKVLPELYADLQPIVDALKNDEKVDLVIGLSHGGIADSSSEATTETGEDYQVAENVKGIDLIVSGHAHNGDAKPIDVKASDHETLVLNAGSFGKQLGRVEFSFPAGAAQPVWDMTSQALLPIDDTTVPDPDFAAKLDPFVDTIEKEPLLADLVSRTEGMTIADDPSTSGDLYFHPIGKTAFDVTEPESVMFLSADAMLAAADAWDPTKPTMMGLESEGVIRGTLPKGKTGTISAADAFAVVPLGVSPIDGSAGNPLARADISLLELRGVFEFGFALGKTDSDYDLRPAGVRVTYDPSRPPAASIKDLVNPAKGWVLKIEVDSDHSDGFEQYDQVLYDRAAGIGDDSALVSIVTSAYIAEFATDVGATLKDDSGMPLALEDAILKRSDGSEVKQLEAFFDWIHKSPGGTLSSRYDASSADASKRYVCTGTACN